ncbi:5'-3' exonuclease [Thermocrinis minervae]|uniref:DNA polymerase-1 n=1 Tax=Thermocrinis minervae TaxID=381751 RepID=A0A1M6S5S8_9AQUI|nr:5'-3' exonuclease H3TH domain-containing protein [Thermocrinis minervae]SHK40154.1 DNA polymerase-1 [Thermocrinis minervae]
MKRLYLLDGSAFIYRSFFALPPLSTKDGFPTSAIYGFLRALLAIMKEENPRYFAICFDHPAPTRRKEVFKEYKSKRPSMPDPLKLQIPVIKRFVDLLGIPRFEVEGYEADDLIASLTLYSVERSFQVNIYSPDKDVLQLISEKVTVVNPMNNEVFDEKKVVEKFGVPPRLIPDYLALVGDKTDNVEGIKGIGPKGALKLLETFGSVENILQNWEKFQRLYPQADREKLSLSYYLVKLHPPPIEIKEEDLLVKEPSLEGLKKELLRYEMKSILQDVEKLYSKPKQRSLF